MPNRANACWWTPDDVIRLKDMLEKNVRVEKICEQLDRSLQSVRAKVVQQGFTMTTRLRRRPATGRHPILSIRMPTELQLEIMQWAETHAEGVNLATAVRKLVRIGLLLKPRPARKSTAERAAAVARANDLAHQAMDKVLDLGNQPAEERAARKQRLAKAPGGRRPR